MGYLLKEALKSLCGVNQWSYAVFWKFGCQNPKLLIWEEFYHGTLSNSSASQNSNIGSQGITSQKMEGYCNGAQVGDPVHFLMDKMMMSNQVIMVGEGLVGRAAFTGNHQWIVSANYNENAHPAEVLNEVCLQFSAGMQTIAVIPVIPHGVVQLGSPFAIMENVGFVHDAKSLILQLGCIQSAFMSDICITKAVSSMYGLAVDGVISIPHNLHGNPMQMTPSPVVADSFNLATNSSQTVRFANNSSNSLLTQLQDNLQVSGSKFEVPNLTKDSCKSYGDHYAAKMSAIVGCSVCPPNGLVGNKFNGDVAMPLKPNSLMYQPACSNNPRSRIMSCPQSSTNYRSIKLLKQAIVSHGSVPEVSELAIGMNDVHGQSVQKSTLTDMLFHDADSSVKELDSFLNTGDQLSSNILGLPNHENCSRDSGYTTKHNPGDVNEILQGHSGILGDMSSGNFAPDYCCNGSQVSSSKDPVSEDVLFQSSAGDDLFDVLGLDLKNKLLNCNDTNLHKFGANTQNQIKDLPRSRNLQKSGSEFYSDYCEGISESGVFSSSGSDNLLDAVVSGVSSAARQISDDTMSCRTTLSKISSSSVNPPISGLVQMSDQMQGQLFGLSKPMMRLGESLGTNGSQISSWIEQGHSVSVSSANLKKCDEVGKTNRKRLKPGENPKPRPKDRQMIQDRVKELREIVPSGAKCSIDALLERTIKHMSFLHCVTKHADKFKKTVESKITNREGRMLLKDNFENGATWAFELGSQSMDCPILVEDLNSPRHLLIEMLCEERGFFLEIADIIRGLGLTILKGVMEARNDKIWARFAVEANRDVTRMEVFISLVHVLEQTLNGCAASANGTTDMRMKADPTPMGANQQLVSPLVCGDPIPSGM